VQPRAALHCDRQVRAVAAPRSACRHTPHVTFGLDRKTSGPATDIENGIAFAEACKHRDLPAKSPGTTEREEPNLQVIARRPMQDRTRGAGCHIAVCHFNLFEVPDRSQKMDMRSGLAYAITLVA
jgi:hypothetical protein